MIISTLQIIPYTYWLSNKTLQRELWWNDKCCI